MQLTLPSVVRTRLGLATAAERPHGQLSWVIALGIVVLISAPSFVAVREYVQNVAYGSDGIGYEVIGTTPGQHVREVLTLGEPTIEAAAFAQPQSLLALADRDGVTVWHVQETADGLVRSLQLRVSTQWPVTPVGLSSDGRTLVGLEQAPTNSSGTPQDYRIEIWNIETSARSELLRGTGSAADFAVSPNATLVATVTDERESAHQRISTTLWRTSDGAEISSLTAPEEDQQGRSVDGLAFGADGKTLIVASHHWKVDQSGANDYGWVWSIPDGRLVAPLACPSSSCSAEHISPVPDSDVVIGAGVTSQDGQTATSLDLWSASTGSYIRRLTFDLPGNGSDKGPSLARYQVRDILAGSDGTIIILRDEVKPTNGYRIDRRSISDGTLISSWHTGSEWNSAAVWPDDGTLALLRSDGLHLISLAKRISPENEARSYAVTNKSIEGGVAYTANGSYLLTGMADGSVVRWRLADGALVNRWLTDESEVARVIVTDPGGWQVASLHGKILHVWRAQSGEDDYTLPDIQEVEFSPDGQTLATIEGVDGRSVVRIRRSADGSIVRQFDSHAAQIMAMAFSPNGAILATQVAAEGLGKGSGNSAEIWFWRLRDGALLSSFAVQDGAFVGGFAFLSDGTLALSEQRLLFPLLHIIHAADGQKISSVPLYDQPFRPAVVASQGHGVLATVDRGGGKPFQLWTADGNVISPVQNVATTVGDAGQDQPLAFAPDGRSFAVVRGGTVGVWSDQR